MKRRREKSSCSAIAMRSALVAMSIILRRAGFCRDIIRKVIGEAERYEIDWFPVDIIIHFEGRDSLSTVLIDAPPNMYWDLFHPWKGGCSGHMAFASSRRLEIFVGLQPREWVNEQVKLAIINLVYYYYFLPAGAGNRGRGTWCSAAVNMWCPASLAAFASACCTSVLLATCSSFDSACLTTDFSSRFA